MENFQVKFTKANLQLKNPIKHDMKKVNKAKNRQIDKEQADSYCGGQRDGRIKQKEKRTHGHGQWGEGI